jgi:N6-L-threonylcarbamoyladenine synthase
MRVLGIETSCDETGVCIIETQESKDGQAITVLGNQLYSQVSKHQEFGGVFPMLAKREHAKNLVPLLEACLKEADLWKKLELFDFKMSGRSSDEETRGLFKLNNLSFETTKENIKKTLEREGELFNELVKLLETIQKPNIDAIAVTNGPGLEPALWVGVVFAKALNEAWGIPVIPTNHMEGHIVVSALSPFPTLDKEGCRIGEAGRLKNRNSFLITETKYPAVALLISGGHTQLVLIKDNLKYEIVGSTRDDAVGEAYDKVARMLSLPYPGGKIISDLAQKERVEFPDKKAPYPLPRPMIKSGDLNFSFSGLKTAVLYTLKKILLNSQDGESITNSVKQEIALEFENAVLDVLTSKVSQAIEEYSPQTLIIGGGVSANIQIRSELKRVCEKYNIKFLVPEVSASTDNALMIALAGFMNIYDGRLTTTDFKANGNLSL